MCPVVLRNVVFVLLLLVATPSTSTATAASFIPSRNSFGRRSAAVVPSPPSSSSWASMRHHPLHGPNDRLTPHHCRKRTCPANALSSIPASSTTAAGGTLVLTSLSGFLFEKNISKSGGGHVVTLLMAAFLSNISQVLSRANNVHMIPSFLTIPTDHFLYDWCWSVFLPASLVFALLSSNSSSTKSSSNVMPPTDDASSESTKTSSTKSNTLRNTILGMMLPFVAGSIGSIIGCITSFHFVPMPHQDNAHIISALLAGCLCASYIGGTVNFFATAKVLKNDMIMGDAAMGSAFGSMAAADLVVMAVYFAMLQTASRSLWLHKLFPSRGCGSGDGMNEEEEGRDNLTEKNSESNTKSYDHDTTKSFSNNGSSWRTRASLISSVVLSFSISLASVMVATRLEQKVTHSFPPPFNPPGTMCAFLALLGIGFQRLIGYVTTTISFDSDSGGDFPSMRPSATSSMHNIIAKSFERISEISPNMSNLCFYLLFAAVGTTADLSSAVAGGPMALAFASLALIIHSITAMSATWIGMRVGKYIYGFIQPETLGILKRVQWPRSSWEEVLTASNAAIGGPSTAAAFAVGLVPNQEADGGVDRSQYRSALVIAATFWGVFGYAIATGIGVAVSRFLMHR